MTWTVLSKQDTLVRRKKPWKFHRNRIWRQVLSLLLHRFSGIVKLPWLLLPSRSYWVTIQLIWNNPRKPGFYFPSWKQISHEWLPNLLPIILPSIFFLYSIEYEAPLKKIIEKEIIASARTTVCKPKCKINLKTISWDLYVLKKLF